MSGPEICRREWSTDRYGNEPGSRSQLGQTWHMCSREPTHDAQHQCECGVRG